MAAAKALARALWLILLPTRNYEAAYGWADSMPWLATLGAILLQAWRGLDWGWWVATGAALLFVLALHAAWRLQYQLDIQGDDVKRIIGHLSRVQVEIGTTHESMANLIRKVGDPFILGLNAEFDLPNKLRTTLGLDPVPHRLPFEIVKILRAYDLIETEHRSGVADSNAEYKTFHNLPHDVYRFNALGNRVYNSLKEPKTQ